MIGVFDILFLFRGEFCHINVAEFIGNLPNRQVLRVDILAILFIEGFSIKYLRLWVNRIIVLTGSILVTFHRIRQVCMTAVYISKRNLLTLAVYIHNNTRYFTVFSMQITDNKPCSFFSLHKIAKLCLIGDLFRFLCLRLCCYRLCNFLNLLFYYRVPDIDICNGAFKGFSVFRLDIGFLTETPDSCRLFPCDMIRIILKVAFQCLYRGAFSFAEYDNIGSDIGTFKSAVRKPPRFK